MALLYRLFRSKPQQAVLYPALDDYDAGCRQHDAEMDAIRPVLFDKFGVIPVIDMYRQCAVRWQKAKDWERARDWAERGIRVYGEHAARPEVVDDLRKRIAHAALKVDAAGSQLKPKPRGPDHRSE